MAGKPKVNFSGFFSYQVGANKCDEKKFFRGWIDIFFKNSVLTLAQNTPNWQII